MSESLFKISNDLINLENELIESGGELSPEMEKALEITQENLKVKCTNYVDYIHSLESDIKRAELYKAKVSDYITKKQKAIERLKSNLYNAVDQFGEVEAGYFKLSMRKSTSLEILNPDDVPGKFKTIKQTVSIDKSMIKKAIKEGEKVKGVELKTNQNLQIK